MYLKNNTLSSEKNINYKKKKSLSCFSQIRFLLIFRNRTQMKYCYFWTFVQQFETELCTSSL